MHKIMSLTETKRRLAEAIELYDNLKQEIDHKDLDAYADDEWHQFLSRLGYQTAQLIQTSKQLDDPHLLSLLKRKQAKLKRHSEWRKRHKKRARLHKLQEARRSERWVMETTMAVSMAPAHQQKSTEKETKEDNLKHKIKKASGILRQLILLRQLRRKRLEAKGHFFAESGNQFFDQVKAWHEQEEGKKNESTSDSLVVHPQDSWQHIKLDLNAYAYWCVAEKSTDDLLDIRRQWDRYINHDGHHQDIYQKVPPVFVTPSPPANAVWASYLL
ncbi:U11/U12 small nuclear ribonucleoprotein [Choanephora cucurbitarum]|uniref:U11/U12 small nuclear ribonucleoprotein n=1 Tax=Choanephora cucurbitarum TaxID=101091 RepID=A0A1C7N1B5_9FUNG|nr:U11/U12 small nuclear ribonucleoprotein [Choanephora cucurbitarum]